MFTEISLKNFRTHRHTTVKLHPITLLIGNNNSGKSNLLQGIRHLSRLVWRSGPRHKPELARVNAQFDYFLHRYRLASDEEPLAWSVKWKGQGFNVSYDLELFQTKRSRDFVSCSERVSIRIGSAKPLEISSGIDGKSNRLGLRALIENDDNLPQEFRDASRTFFVKLGGAFAYHLQPSFLNMAVEENTRVQAYEQNERVRIPSALGFEGGSFQRLIFHAKEKEERVFSRFVALVRRFNDDFHSVRLNDRGYPIWEFDLGSPRTDRPVEEFSPALLSDGFLKAAAIALIVSVDSPPSIIMLEEIENGINPGNIREVMHWLWQAVSTQPGDGKSQFILTSHSPSVLREFSEELDNVYNLRLDRKTYSSDVRNLNATLEAMVGIGAIEGDVAIDDKGEKIVRIPAGQLTDLWYEGTIG